MEIDRIGLVHTPSLDNYLMSGLVKRLRRKKFAPVLTPIDFNKVDFQGLTREQLEVCKGSLDLDTIPNEIFYQLLDNLVDLEAEYSGIHLEDLHTLHAIAQYNQLFSTRLRHWTSQVKVRSAFHATIWPYQGPAQVHRDVKKFQRKFNTEALHKDGLDLARINNLDLEECSLVHAAARKCRSCVNFLFYYGLIEIDGFDGWGRNYLYGAIEVRNARTLEWLLDAQINQLRTTGVIEEVPLRFTPSKENNPLKHAIEQRWLTGCELIIDRMLKVHKTLDAYFDDEMKLGLCGFVPVALAEKLRNRGINIGDVGIRPVKSKRNVTTSWHAAAAENPHGADFMRWLTRYSGGGPDIMDWRNYNPLHAAAGGTTPASVDWLCRKLLHGQQEERVQDQRGQETRKEHAEQTRPRQQVIPSEREDESDSEEESESDDSDSDDDDEGRNKNPLESIEIAAMSTQARSKDIFRIIVRHWASRPSNIQDMDEVEAIFQAICWGAFKATRKEPGNKNRIVKTAARKCRRLKSKLGRQWLDCKQRRQLLERAKKYELEGLTHSMTPETR